MQSEVKLLNPFNKHPFARDVIWGFFEFGLCFMVFNYFRNAIHEWLHLGVLQYFGGDGYIVNNFFGVGVHITKLCPHMQLVAFAGGIGVAAFYALLMYMDWDDDPEQAAAFPPLILSQLFYGVTEGLWIFSMSAAEFNRVSDITYQAGWIIGFAVSIFLMVKWLVNLDKKYSKKWQLF